MAKFGRFSSELNSLHPFNLEELIAGLIRLKHGRKNLPQVDRDILLREYQRLHMRKGQQLREPARMI